MKPKTKPNGDRYWEYVLVYVNNILCISHEPSKFMETLQVKYTLKKGSVGEPTAYLGTEVCKHYHKNVNKSDTGLYMNLFYIDNAHESECKYDKNEQFKNNENNPDTSGSDERGRNKERRHKRTT
jgi:hypothetical protein